MSYQDFTKISVYTEISLKSKLLRWASFGDVGARQLEPKLLWQTTVSSSCLAPTDRSIEKVWFHSDLSIAVE
jgi:hypothetical protein